MARRLLYVSKENYYKKQIIQMKWPKTFFCDIVLMKSKWPACINVTKRKKQVTWNSTLDFVHFLYSVLKLRIIITKVKTQFLQIFKNHIWLYVNAIQSTSMLNSFYF